MHKLWNEYFYLSYKEKPRVTNLAQHSLSSLKRRSQIRLLILINIPHDATPTPSNGMFILVMQGCRSTHVRWYLCFDQIVTGKTGAWTCILVWYMWHIISSILSICLKFHIRITNAIQELQMPKATTPVKISLKNRSSNGRMTQTFSIRRFEAREQVQQQLWWAKGDVH